MPSATFFHRVFAIAMLLCGMAWLVGCGSDVTSTPIPPPTGVPFTASVMAGTMPITGAAVSLYAAGTTGNGTGATSLLSTTVTTDADGVANIPSSYSCPAQSSLLYLVSSGGAVAGQSTANANAVLMTPVGSCGVVTTLTKVTINEATTVGSMYALAPFYSSANGIGTSSTNLLGLTNAFATAATLADPVSGSSSSPSLPANAASPAPRVNSVANMVNACVVSSAACAGLYAAVASGGTAPANTLDAVYDLARAPTTNVTALFAQAKLSTAYSPALTAAPKDWTIFLTLSGGGLSDPAGMGNNPSGLGVDSQGNVWVSTYFYYASKFSPTGAVAIAGGITGDGLNNSYGLAIDTSDNVWIPNEQPNYGGGNIGSVTELSSSGTSVAGCCGYTGGGLNYPVSIAIDPNGTVWVVDYGDSHVTLLNASGQPLSGASGYTTASFAFPVVVAVDHNHFGWVGNLSDTRVTKVAPDGSSFTAYDCCNGAAGIAIDQGNNVWISNFYGNSVSMISSAGTIVSNQAYTGLGSIDRPQGIAVDGAGNLWLANYRQPYLTELAGASSASPGSSLTPAAGLGADAQLLEAYALAIDASGNIWVSNQGSNTITKFIGLAAPVKTPLSGLPQLP